MNLRTLKKLSKRAAPLLPLLGDHRQQFPSERGDNYGIPFIGDRKHWDRSHCHPTYEGWNGWSTPRGASILYVTRAGRHMVMRPPSHPRRGTVMVGATSGYYEPEWDEETAWIALVQLVHIEFTDWSEDGATPLRVFNSPSEVLRAAEEMAKAAALKVAR